MTSSATRIRAFTLRDYKTVVALWKASGLDFSAGDEPVEIRRKLKRDPELFVVALRGGKVVGAAIGAWDGRRGWIYHLAVGKGSRRMGVATKLLEEIEARMRRKGVLKVNAIVYKINDASLALFQKNGFGVQDDQYVVGKYLDHS